MAGLPESTKYMSEYITANSSHLQARVAKAQCGIFPGRIVASFPGPHAAFEIMAGGLGTRLAELAKRVLKRFLYPVLLSTTSHWQIATAVAIAEHHR